MTLIISRFIVLTLSMIYFHVTFIILGTIWVIWGCKD